MTTPFKTQKPRSQWRKPEPSRRVRGRVAVPPLFTGDPFDGGIIEHPAFVAAMRADGVTVRFRHSRRPQLLGWAVLAAVAAQQQRVQAAEAEQERRRVAEDAAQLKLL